MVIFVIKTMNRNHMTRLLLPRPLPAYAFFTLAFFIFFFIWDSLHARLNSRYEAWCYKKKEHKKVKAYRKSV